VGGRWLYVAGGLVAGAVLYMGWKQYSRNSTPKTPITTRPIVSAMNQNPASPLTTSTTSPTTAGLMSNLHGKMTSL
jgi:hypothetical protein